MARDVVMQDAQALEEEKLMYGHDQAINDDLNEKYPHRPHNHAGTLPFHTLFQDLFNPLNDNRKRTNVTVTARKKVGPDGPFNRSPNQIKYNIIQTFVARWRKNVGDDFYPAMRLIVPEKDRDRAMYGLKEKTIAKLLVKLTGIDKNAEDPQSRMNWKLPGFKASASAGDFAGRCFDVLSKRPLRTVVGDMTIAQVNVDLDRLSSAAKEEEQYSILQAFYQRMNAEEMMWLIRVICRQMKIGATERTFFDLWHPDAEKLFNVSSSLRRVCWELSDPEVRLEDDRSAITLMQCFQPQLAAFQLHSFEKIVARMRPTDTDDFFWIEEKLDGERMQMHMIEDESIPGGKRFAFWSRKAKDYTYLYGNGLFDETASLTRHLRDAFDDGVRNIVLDGEMIGWSMEENSMTPFGSLKTAALEAQQNSWAAKGLRPVFYVFDCLYINDKPITSYTLRDRRRALEASVKSIPFRLKIHDYMEGRVAADIEPVLRDVVAEASEGLVIKSPRSIYRLNERNDDWVKVKPEYMNEFGEDLDCVVIGGYYGSGNRGGGISSFMCGLRIDDHHVRQGADPQKCYSFFKVGGGFSADDYAAIRHQTEGKWIKWDPKKPPHQYIELDEKNRQPERPDVWIKPEDSVVFSVKAASVSSTAQFRVGFTLRFPRFKRLRNDKDWKSALSVIGFIELKNNAEREKTTRQFEIDKERQMKRAAPRKKIRTILVAGEDEVAVTQFGGPATKVFEGLVFFVITESLHPVKKSKNELEEIIKANGGALVQSQNSKPNVICVADREPIKVRSIRKDGKMSIVKPSWIFDCINQAEASADQRNLVIPMEPDHMHFTCEADYDMIQGSVDKWGDSYCRDSSADQLKTLFEGMFYEPVDDDMQIADTMARLEKPGDDWADMPGNIFRQCHVLFGETCHSGGDKDRESFAATMTTVVGAATRYIQFGGGSIAASLEDLSVTHVVAQDNDTAQLREIRQMVARRRVVPRIVSLQWVMDSWNEKTRLNEERYAMT